MPGLQVAALGGVAAHVPFAFCRARRRRACVPVAARHAVRRAGHRTRRDHRHGGGIGVEVAQFLARPRRACPGTRVRRARPRTCTPSERSRCRRDGGSDERRPRARARARHGARRRARGDRACVGRSRGERYDSAFRLRTRRYDFRWNPRIATAARVADIAPFHVMEVQTAARALEAAGRTVVHMEIGEPDFPTPAPVIAAAQRGDRRGDIYYTSALGLPELRRGDRAPLRRPLRRRRRARARSSSPPARRPRCCW